jgi:hypothetical protein
MREALRLGPFNACTPERADFSGISDRRPADPGTDPPTFDAS